MYASPPPIAGVFARALTKSDLLSRALLTSVSSAHKLSVAPAFPWNESGGYSAGGVWQRVLPPVDAQDFRGGVREAGREREGGREGERERGREREIEREGGRERGGGGRDAGASEGGRPGERGREGGGPGERGREGGREREEGREGGGRERDISSLSLSLSADVAATRISLIPAGDVDTTRANKKKVGID